MYSDESVAQQINEKRLVSLFLTALFKRLNLDLSITATLEARTSEEGQTPLHFAARNDAVESLKVLIKLGADKESKDFRQRTPLFVAAELGRAVFSFNILTGASQILFQHCALASHPALVSCCLLLVSKSFSYG